MTDLRKAAEMALDALRYTCDHLPAKTGVEREVDDAITALQVALAHPEQQYVIDCPRCGHCCPEREDWEAVAADQAMTIAMMQIENKKEWVGLTDAQIYEHEWWDEQTAFAVNKELRGKNIAPYTKNDTSDRVLHKQWVGLTDEDIDVYALDIGVTANKAPSWLVKYARDIEAALKEKNRG